MTTLSSLGWTHKGWQQYRITEADYAALVRAVAHEGKPYAGVAWCLIQRFCWVYPIYEELGVFVTAYAQPINPRWFPDGDKHKAYMKRNHQRRPSRARDEERRAKRRVEYAQQPLEELTKYADVVEAIMRGETPSPVEGAVHYSASFAKAGARGYDGYIAASQAAKRRRIGPVINAGVGYNQGVNWFFAAGGSNRVNNMGLVIVPPGQPCDTVEESNIV